MGSPVRLSSDGLAFLSHEEGLRTSPYLDEGNNWTIGVGHLITPQEQASGTILIGGTPAPYKQGLSLAQVRDLLAQDCAPRETDLSRIIVCPLSDNQFAAAFSLYFNAQPPASSTVWQIINGGDWTDLPAHWLQWDHVRVNGVLVESTKLKARRQRELDLWGTPDA